MEANRPFNITRLFLLAFCLFVSSVQATAVKYCDKKGHYDVKVEGVDMVPDPVVSGKPATFKISASTGKTISGGKLSLEVKFFGVTVHTESHNICEKTSCPISAGKFVLSHTQLLPGITPPGSYTLRMRLEDANKHQLTCVSFQFKIISGSYVSSL